MSICMLTCLYVDVLDYTMLILLMLLPNPLHAYVSVITHLHRFPYLSHMTRKLHLGLDTNAHLLSLKDKHTFYLSSNDM